MYLYIIINIKMYLLVALFQELSKEKVYIETMMVNGFQVHGKKVKEIKNIQRITFRNN